MGILKNIFSGWDTFVSQFLCFCVKCLCEQLPIRSKIVVISMQQMLVWWYHIVWPKLCCNAKLCLHIFINWCFIFNVISLKYTIRNQIVWVISKHCGVVNFRFTILGFIIYLGDIQIKMNIKIRWNSKNGSINHWIFCAYNYTHKIFRLSSRFENTPSQGDFLESKFSRPVTPTEKVITNFTFPYSAMQRKLVEEKEGSRNIYNIA